MVKEDIRHYTIDDLRKMIERGDYVATPPDAPLVDFDEDFWNALENEGPAPTPTEPVVLNVSRSTLDFFTKDGSRDLSEMARILEAYAASKGKRAS